MMKSYFLEFKNNIFKILPLYEENNPYLCSYIDSLLFELNGVCEVYKQLKNNKNYISLCAILESLYDEALVMDENHEIVKREVFKCIRILEKIADGEES